MNYKEEILKVIITKFDPHSKRANPVYDKIKIEKDLKILYEKVKIANESVIFNIDAECITFGCKEISFKDLQIISLELKGIHTLIKESGFIRIEYQNDEILPSTEIKKWKLKEKTENYFICKNLKNQFKLLLKEKYIYMEKFIQYNILQKKNHHLKNVYYAYKDYEICKDSIKSKQILLHKVDYLLSIINYIKTKIF